jgi:hypothetical protein
MNSQINPEIRNALTQYKVENQDAALLYLFCIREELPVDIEWMEVNELTVKQVHLTKICEAWFDNATPMYRKTDNIKIKWNIPFYLQDKITEESNWEWLKRYRDVFTAVRSDKGGSKSGVTIKMKKFFAANPEVRAEDVIDAARLYVEQNPNADFIQQADYFISKSANTINQTSRLEQYLEMVYERRKQKQIDIKAPKR